MNSIKSHNEDEKPKPTISEKSIIKYIFLIAALILCIMNIRLIYNVAADLMGIVFPLILGGAISYILSIIITRLEKIYFPDSKNEFINKSRSLVTLVLSIVLIVAILFFVMNMVVPELFRAISTLARFVPGYWNQLIAYLSDNQEFPLTAEAVESLQIDWESLGKQVVGYAGRGLSGIVNSTVSAVSTLVGALVNFFVAFSFAIYITIGKDKLKRQVNRMSAAFIPEKWRRKISIVLTTMNECFSSFIIGQFTEAVLLGVLCNLGMLLLRFPYATAVGTLVGVTALIPIFGAWIGAIVGALLIMVVSPVKAVMFLIFIVVLQQLDNNLIYPRVVGTSIGLPGIWVLAAITVGGGFGGVIGMLLGVPMAATVYKLIKLAVDRRLRE